MTVDRQELMTIKAKKAFARQIMREQRLFLLCLKVFYVRRC